jgi:eukaryotic-like serine/threonine-protein kinase
VSVPKSTPLPSKKKIRIFISSPSDVQRERHLSERVIQRLSDDFSQRVILDPYFWEYEPMRVSQGFQAQIEPTSSFDLVICILWSRLGTPLVGPDGRAYKSGTEYEIDSALRSWSDRGSPEVMVYHNQSPVLLPRTPKEERERAYEQLVELEEFLEARSIDRISGLIKGAITNYENLGQFEILLERHLRKFVEKRSEAPLDSTLTVKATDHIWKRGSPFRGLESFEFEHESIFFGRTEAIGEVLDQLRRQTQRLNDWRSNETPPLRSAELPEDSLVPGIFVLISAISGVGKSSLVRAGVLPLLTKRGVVEGVDVWRRAVMRPSESTGDIFDGLVQALVRSEALPELTSGGDSFGYLASKLRENPAVADLLISPALARVEDATLKEDQKMLQSAAEQSLREGRLGDREFYEKSLRELPRKVARLILVIDQFEEIFTISNTGDAAGTRCAFISALASLARSGKVWIIATLRSDFFPRCVEIPELMALKRLDGHYDLQPPTKEEIGDIVRKSAAAGGLRYERTTLAGNEVSLDEVLRDTMVDNPASLPLLEFCLDELYKRRTSDGVLTFAAYDELGRLEGSLEKRAEAIFCSLDLSAQASFDHVMRGVTSIGLENEATFTRRWADYEQLTGSSGAKVFVDEFLAPSARLFVADRTGDGRAIVSVAHEALLTAWKRLSLWLVANRESLQVRAHISSVATQWSEAKEDDKNGYLLNEGLQLEKAKEAFKRGYLEANEAQFVEACARAVAAQKNRESRRRKILLMTIGGALVLALLFAVVSLWQAQQAAALAERERTARTNAERSARAAEFLAKQRQESVEAANRARSEADALINYIFTDLKTKLLPLGRLNLLADPAKRIREYFENLPKDEVTVERLLDQRAAFDTVGDVFALVGSYGEAVGAYEEALKLSNALAEVSTDNTTIQRDLVSTREKIGDVFSLQHNYREALDQYNGAQQIVEALLARDSKNSDLRRHMCAIYQKIGDISSALGDIKTCLHSYEQSVAIERELLADDSNNRDYSRDLEVGLNRIGNVCRSQANWEQSLKYHQEALEIAERLAEQDPKNQNLQRDLILCRYWTGLSLALSSDAQSKQSAKMMLQMALDAARSYLGTERETWKNEIEKALQSLNP